MTTKYDLTVTGQASSLITAMDTALVTGEGWEKMAFSDATRAIYRSTDVQGTRLYLQVDDSGDKWARVIGYETMTAIYTGTGQFPTSAQLSGGGYYHKSNTADAVERDHYIVADSRGFYIFGDSYNNPSYLQDFWFGDFVSLRAASTAYDCLLACGDTNSASSFTGKANLASPAAWNAWLPRAASYTGISEPALGFGYVSASGDIGSYPSPLANGLLYNNRVLVYDDTLNNVRGWMPGLRELLCDFGNSANDTGQGTVISTVDGDAVIMKSALTNANLIDLGDWR